MRSPWSLLVSKLNKPSSLSLSSQERCSSPLIILVALLWTCYKSSTSFLCWGPQVWTQCCRWDLTREGKSRWGQSSPCYHPPVGAAQDTVGILGCKSTLSVHVQLSIRQDSQVLLYRAALNEFFS